METVQGGQRLTLCWSCKNTNRHKCSWFNPVDPQPVPGWVAELRPKARIGESYMVKECPNFDPEPRPAHTGPAIHGVHRKGTKWVAVISHKGKTYHLGTFDDYEEAVAARRAAEEAIGRDNEQTRRGVGRPSTCGGVYFRAGRWEAIVPYEGRRCYLGRFDTKEEAAAARKAAEKAVAQGEDPRRSREIAARPDHHPGVSHHGSAWEARIKRNGKFYYLGRFKAEEEAIAARRAAEEAISRGEEPTRKAPQPREPKPNPPQIKKAGPRACKGVYFCRGYWEARISCKGQVISLGYFKAEEDAIAARKAAEKSIKLGMTPRAAKRR